VQNGRFVEGGPRCQGRIVTVNGITSGGTSVPRDPGDCDDPFMLRAVLLDVNGTLTDPSAIGAVWARPDLGERVLQHAISTAMVAALLGDAKRTFREHLSAAIDVIAAAAHLDPHRSAQALDAAASLPARPDAPDALAALRDAGLRIVALTNSGADAGRATLRACSLLPLIEQVLGVDAVSTFKPHPAVYAYALSELTEDPDSVALIATHPWDLAGAAHAGIRTAWVRHQPRAWPSVFPTPDVQAETLTDLADAILSRR
jgi:2-haloacid dehalogenase